MVISLTLCLLPVSSLFLKVNSLCVAYSWAKNGLLKKHWSLQLHCCLFPSVHLILYYDCSMFVPVLLDQSVKLRMISLFSPLRIFRLEFIVIFFASNLKVNHSYEQSRQVTTMRSLFCRMQRKLATFKSSCQPLLHSAL